MDGRSDKFDITTYLESVLDNLPEVDQGDDPETDAAAANDAGDERIGRRRRLVIRNPEQGDSESAQEK